MKRPVSLVAAFVLASILPSVAEAALPSCTVTNPVQFCEVDDIVPPTDVSELIYAPAYGELIFKNSQSTIVVLDIATHNSSFYFSNWNFTDIALSPSGRYVFAADYGGENIGYGTPLHTSYVHRLDLANLTWDLPESAYIAGKIQVVDDNTFVLMSLDQWVSFTLDRWTMGTAVTVLNSSNDTTVAPAYYANAYAGDIRYVSNSGRLLHGNPNETWQMFQAYHLFGNEFAAQEETGTFPTTQPLGSRIALATDESAFYAGALAVDPLDVTHNLGTFPEPIYAATGDIAFGANGYYDAHTLLPLGSLGVSGDVYGLSATGSDFWVYDSAQNLLRHFVKDRVFSDGFGG